MLTHLVDKLLNLIFPDRCAGCKSIGALLCLDCRAALQPYPTDNVPDALDAVEVAHIFGGVLRPAIHELKYRKRRRMAAPLGELLVAHLRAHPLPADVLLPVPLHEKRLSERGFNQSELLAQHVARASGLPVLTHDLVRVRATGQQAHLDARARRENMRDAFAWTGSTPPPARVLILDDVLTTGSTITACAHALRAAGAVEVRALALARSRPGQDR